MTTAVDDWVCNYCGESFSCREDWVDHLRAEHSIGVEAIVEPLDRADRWRFANRFGHY